MISYREKITELNVIIIETVKKIEKVQDIDPPGHGRMDDHYFQTWRQYVRLSVRKTKQR